MGKKELYAEYEKVYTGVKKNVSLSFFKGSPESAKENAIIIMRYAFEKMLNWAPEDISNSLTMEILRQMHLTNLIRFLQIPYELSAKLDSRYFAHVLYPEKIYYDEKGITLSIYKRVLSGELAGYPKKFFHEEDGYVRAKACMSYILHEKLIFSNLEDVYRHFLTQRGRADIQKYHLVTALSAFETPVDYVHESLPASQQDEFLFQFYKFKFLYKRELYSNRFS